MSTSGYLSQGQKYVVNENRVTITGNCKLSGKPYTMVLDADQFFRWKSGALLQSAIPNASEEQRSILTTGVTKSSGNLLLG
jgi:hypothetical protein